MTPANALFDVMRPMALVRLKLAQMLEQQRNSLLRQQFALQKILQLSCELRSRSTRRADC